MNSLWPFLHFLLLFTQLPVYRSSLISDRFDSWRKEYGKTYASVEEKQWRLKIFKENYDYIVQHNMRGNSSYTLALNAFADLSSGEFQARYLGLLPSVNDPVIRLNSRPAAIGRSDLVDGSDLPPSVDWREKGAVNPVRNQYDCAASWAFAATGAVEGISQIVTGDLVSLSVQELVDCDTSNDACVGGLMDHAYEFIIKNKGIDTEEDYPYVHRNRYCHNYQMERHVVTIDSYAVIPAKNEKMIQQAVAAQPVSVGICGSERSFRLYHEGIYSGPCSCSLKHAVLIVGYGSEDGNDYWIIKNSWGKFWGMAGYMHMLRNAGSAEGICGINMLASYPIKSTPNPPLPPPPTECTIFTYCGPFEHCCCTFRFIGICWYWECCATESAVLQGSSST